MDTQIRKAELYRRNIAVNSIPLILFLAGKEINNPWLLNAGLIIFWATVILSPIVLLPPRMHFEIKMTRSQLKRTIGLIDRAMDPLYRYINITWDLGIVSMLAYFGYDILAILYTLHIGAYIYGLDQIKYYLIEHNAGDRLEEIHQEILDGVTEFDPIVPTDTEIEKEI